MNILLLGGIGSGKSMALEILRDKYFANTIEADKLAHSLYEKGQKGYDKLVLMFGEDILDDKKNIDRKKLADILYCDNEKLKRVNSEIHPLVMEEVKKRLRSGLNVVEQALLPDGSIKYDEIWYLHADMDIRKERLIKSRGLDSDRIISIVSKQPGEKDYRRVADKVIENNEGADELEKRLREALGETG